MDWTTWVQFAVGRRRHQGPPKPWYPTAALHGVTTQKTSTWIFTAVKTSNLASSQIMYAKSLE